MTDEDFAKRIEARLASLEELAQHCSNPEDREVDRLLRRAFKGGKAFFWLLKHLTVLAGVVIAAWMAWDKIAGVFR